MKGHYHFLLAIIFLIIGILTIVQIVVTNRLSTSGVILGALRKEISSQELENKILKTEIASSSSIIHVSQRAEELGFVKDFSPLVLAPAQSFALR